MKRKKELKPTDILLKIYLKRLLKMQVHDSVIYNDLEEAITNPNTRYRAKKRVKKLIEEIKKEDKSLGIKKFN